MSVGTVITQGFGTFGDIAHVVLDGYDPSSVPPPAPAPEVGPPLGGKGDGKRRILSVKPTGLLDRPRADKKPVDKRVEQRVADSRQIQAEVAGELARQLRQEIDREVTPVVMMDLAAVEAEIGRILRKKVRTDEDEVVLLLLMVAVST